MVIDKSIADYIISELKPVVSFDINLIGNDGIIISSTNIEREGTLHHGAMELVRNNWKELIIKEDEEYEGCKKGINLPVIVGNERVAIVGITGNPDEVIKQGTIVKKMTEMLLQYDIDRMLKARWEKSNLLLINDLINGNNVSSKDMENRIIECGLKCSGPFSVAILQFRTHVSDSEIDDEIVFFEKLNEKIHKYFTAQHMLCAYKEDSFVILANTESSRLRSVIEQLQDAKGQGIDYGIRCSIGNERYDYKDICKIYNEALMTETYLPEDAEGIFFFNAAELDVLVNQIPANSMRIVLNNIFADCSEDEISQFCEFILMYFNYNGSISKISEHTYQHKNTVQYKISKIKRKTNLDLRVSHDLFVLYIAARFYGQNNSNLI